MKKQTLFGFIVLATIVLAGCEMPFVVTEKETLENYVEAQAEIVQASLEVDEQLQLSLQATLKETEKKDFPSEQLMNEVRSAKRTQNELYQQVSKQNEPYGKESVKQVYLDAIGTHVSSYAHYIETLKKAERKTFTQTLTLNQIKEDDVLAQSLLLLNQTLEEYRIEPRETLLPIEKKSEKE